MTRSIFPLIAFTLFAIRLSAQTCYCPDEFQTLKEYMERNYAGFNDKVTPATRAAYDSTSAAAYRLAKSIKRPLFCLALMRQWLNFFQDAHNYLTQQTQPACTDCGETVLLPASTLTELQTGKSIQGIYYNRDSTYKIAIVKNKNAGRDFVGVMLESRAPTWKPGQIKLELKAAGPNRYLAISYLRDHSAEGTEMIFDGTTINNGAWFRAGSPKPHAGWVSRPVLQARRLSAKTYYIGLGSFDEGNAAAIDSLFRADSVLLRSIPNLILDLRGNGGGSDFVYGPVTPVIYGGPFKITGVDVRATTDNIKSWSLLLGDKYITGELRFWIQMNIAAMKANPGQFIPATTNRFSILPEVRTFPQRVAVLIDEDCGSTTEQFLLEAMQSKKVTLMGQHTRGVLDYANVRTVALPCLPYTLNYATTRSRRIDQGKGIDNVGIQPAIVLGDDVDWVVAARKYLEQ